MLNEILWLIYLFILALGSVIILFRIKRWDRALQLFGILIPLTFITEVLNFLLDYIHLAKSPVSHIFSIFELSLTAIYFLYTNWERPPPGSLVGVCVAATVIGLADMKIQSINSYNTIMLMVESFSISAMALYSLYHISFNPAVARVRTYPHFIIWTALLAGWTGTFFFWVFLSFLKEHKELYRLVTTIQLFYFMVIYGIFALVFYHADFKTAYSREPVPYKSL